MPHESCVRSWSLQLSPEHLEHALRDEEASEDVATGAEGSEEGAELREEGGGSELQQRAQDDDAADCVGH